MITKRLVAAAFAFSLGLMLGACTSFSGFVSDHWPHFAGGEPDGVPPRPGAPGYTQFIAHGQPGESGAPGAGNAQSAAPAAPAANAHQKTAGPTQSPAASGEPSADEEPPATAAPAVARPVNESGVVQGGLY